MQVDCVIKLFKDLFTERDGVSYCLGRFIAFAAAVEMIYKFTDSSHIDYQGFAVGICAIIASIAAKNMSEK